MQKQIGESSCLLLSQTLKRHLCKCKTMPFFKLIFVLENTFFIEKMLIIWIGNSLVFNELASIFKVSFICLALNIESYNPHKQKLLGAVIFSQEVLTLQTLRTTVLPSPTLAGLSMLHQVLACPWGSPNHPLLTPPGAPLKHSRPSHYFNSDMFLY